MTRPSSTMKPGGQADPRLDPIPDILAGGDPSVAPSPDRTQPGHRSEPQPVGSQAKPTRDNNPLSPVGPHTHYPDAQAEAAQQSDDNHGQNPVIAGTTDDSDDQLYFVLGWRHIWKGRILSQGVANHETPANQLPDRLRAALLDWLKSRK